MGIVLASITIFTVLTYSARAMLGYEDRAAATDIKQVEIIYIP